MKQYVPLKPVKHKFRIWVKADSINGFRRDCSVYTSNEASAEKDLNPNVVKKVSPTFYWW